MIELLPPELYLPIICAIPIEKRFPLKVTSKFFCAMIEKSLEGHNLHSSLRKNWVDETQKNFPEFIRSHFTVAQFSQIPFESLDSCSSHGSYCEAKKVIYSQLNETRSVVVGKMEMSAGSGWESFYYSFNFFALFSVEKYKNSSNDLYLLFYEEHHYNCDGILWTVDEHRSTFSPLNFEFTPFNATIIPRLRYLHYNEFLRNLLKKKNVSEYSRVTFKKDKSCKIRLKS